MSKHERILIIEDDIDFTEAMKVTLKPEQYEILSASDPEDGYKLAKKEKPDLIILDVMFGEEEMTKGFDYALKLKKDKALAPIPILMVTAVNVRHSSFHFSPDSDGKFLPVDDFIDKPAQPEELVEKVKKLLEMKTSRWADWPQTPNNDSRGR
jgi:two-component system alkaline phosphatase synthesis response regulator PhoP